jgi:hypothetical protein
VTKKNCDGNLIPQAEFSMAHPSIVLEYRLEAERTGTWKGARTRRLESLRYVAKKRHSF